jgi:hypothetical protein
VEGVPHVLRFDIMSPMAFDAGSGFVRQSIMKLNPDREGAW